MECENAMIILKKLFDLKRSGFVNLCQGRCMLALTFLAHATVSFLGSMAGSATVPSFSSAFSNSGTVAAGKCCLDHSKSFALRLFTLSKRKNFGPISNGNT